MTFLILHGSHTLLAVDVIVVLIENRRLVYPYVHGRKEIIQDEYIYDAPMYGTSVIVSSKRQGRLVVTKDF